ncbi:MAG: nitroreductase family protein [Anaerolineae bacterium]|nr:nitroreductase family protein [Anaerolineae bacterium]
METMEAIRKRKALKNCLCDREIEREKLEQILQAAGMAPSARNKQPWRFVVVQGKENVERVAEKAFVGFAKGNLVVKEANVLIFAFANHEENVFPDGAFFYPTDVGLAFENLLLAATDLGLVTHPMAAVDQAELKKVLGVPEGERLIIFTPLSYPDPGSYDEAVEERQATSTRKSLSEIAYINEWGKPF